MRYKYLQFFDNGGNNLNLNYNTIENIWKGTCYIPEVSTGLYESANIYIIEEFFNENTNKIEYGLPHSKEIVSCINTWNIRWESDKTEEIFLYQFDLKSNHPTLEIITDTLEVEVDNSLNDTIITDGKISSNNINTRSLQLNIGLNSDVEDLYERKLIIEEKISGIRIAEIIFYGETIAEDERFKILLSNFGMSLFPEDQTIFRESDINEFAIDYKLINRKRKEMLLEGKNIFPFKGSYKGLINIIKFFGYDNIKLREAWLNIDSTSAFYGKYKYTDVINIFDDNVDFKDSNINLPNKIFKKTSKFQLAYNINKITDDVDEYDIPQTEETSDFTTEEVLIKLYGLKERLKKSYLPFNAKIIDIVGEADYFTKTKMNVWTDQQRIEYIDSGIHPNFNISPSQVGYVQDLRTLRDIFFPEATPYSLDHDMRVIGETGMTIAEVSDVMLAYFTNYNPNLNTVAQLPDKPGIKAGYPCVLTNTSFDILFDDAKVQWDELYSSGSISIEFNCNNVLIGDKFIITENISGETIEYTATSADTDNVIDGLLSSFNTAVSLGDGRPWSYFSSVKIDNNTFRITRIFTGYKSFVFQLSTIPEHTWSTPIFTKHFSNTSQIYTWSNFGNGNFYEIEWFIFKEANDTPAWQYNIRGSINDYNSLPLELPYVGTYTVQMKLYDTFNNISEKYSKEYITVESKNVEFSGFYKFRELKYYWDFNKSVTFDEYASEWELPIIPISNTEEGHASLYESLDRANYILNNQVDDMSLSYNYDNLQEQESYTSGAYYWDNITSGNWNDSYHLTWSSCKVSGDSPANFRIYSTTVNGSLEIWQNKPQLNYGIHSFASTDLEVVANNLNNSTDPVISKYLYNLVTDYDSSLSYPPTEVVFIQAVAKYFGKNGDWTKIESTGIDLRYTEFSETSNPTFNDIRFINDWQELPKLIYITFTYDKCTIPGKDKPIWHLINLDSTNTDDIYFEGRWFTYLFKREGHYQLSLELEDSNGNKTNLQKNQLVIK
jgi:hypothetical protein